MTHHRNSKERAAGVTDTVSFHLSDVPEYLRQTDFYSSLEDDGEEIIVPKEVFKTDLNISNQADVHELLSTMRFWGVEKVPSELIMYVAKSSHQDLDDLLSNFTQELRAVEFLRVLNIALQPIQPSSYSRNVGWWSLKRRATTTESVVHILTLQFQYERGQIWNERTTALVAKMGWLDCLTFLHEFGCPWDESTCANAAENKHLDCLTYARTHGCPWDAQTTGCALKSRHTECFAYARDHGCPWDASSCSTAARSGNLALLQSAHESGCPWDEGTCEEAARATAMDCLHYAHEQGCPWNASVCATAASSGNLAMLVYAHEQGCPWDETTCQKAAEHGHLACLTYAHEQGCAWNEETCMEAAENDHIGCLVYAHEQGCPWDANTSVAAAWCNSTACLNYCHKHGCPWNEEVVTRAANYGKLDCLRYALEHGCPGREIACVSVYSSFECLKYLREEQLCPWDARIADNFARSLFHETECLQYCLEQGCLADENTFCWRCTVWRSYKYCTNLVVVGTNALCTQLL